jgi:uncharacterized protein YkwD
MATLAAFMQQSAAQQISPFPENRQPSPKILASAQPSPIEDPAAEQELLELANQQRREEGLPLLRRDARLSDAARTHARRMVERQQLSHQFEGEPSLMPRLLEVGLQIDRVGENVAYNASAEKAFVALMQSPPHRRNLLDPSFNTAGFAAFWSDGRLYVVQDFAHQLPQLTPASTK